MQKHGHKHGLLIAISLLLFSIGVYGFIVDAPRKNASILSNDWPLIAMLISPALFATSLAIIVVLLLNRKWPELKFLYIGLLSLGLFLISNVICYGIYWGTPLTGLLIIFSPFAIFEVPVIATYLLIVYFASKKILSK